jgi:lysophospholipase L1-like esterase
MPDADLVPDPDPERFSAAIAGFDRWDSKNSFPSHATLFVGSSSIRLWPTAMAFPDQQIINRGFGGSELSDVIHYFDSVVLRYAPRRIVLYAGDNDVASGKSADQVFADFLQLAALVRRDLPGTELVFISIKPSKARWHLWPVMVAANRKVEAYVQQHAGLRYADLATPLLDEAGEPGDYYVEDGLHLNAAGYALWQRTLRPFLDQAAPRR